MGCKASVYSKEKLVSLSLIYKLCGLLIIDPVLFRKVIHVVHRYFTMKMEIKTVSYGAHLENGRYTKWSLVVSLLVITCSNYDIHSSAF